MSALDELKKRLSQLAEDSRKVGSDLGRFEQKFTEQSKKVSAEIGNTSTGVDKQIIATLQAASKALEQSIGALQKASKDCGDFANSL